MTEEQMRDYWSDRHVTAQIQHAIARTLADMSLYFVRGAAARKEWRAWRREAKRNRTRGARRTDFARGRRRGWFEGGRSIPVVEVTHAWSSVLAPGCPIPIIGASLGEMTDRGRVVVIDHQRETLWVTPS